MMLTNPSHDFTHIHNRVARALRELGHYEEAGDATTIANVTMEALTIEDLESLIERKKLYERALSMDGGGI